jgi:SAM-dependent methyltransferase
MLSIDYGYPWWLSYGHLPILLVMLTILLVGSLRRWPIWLRLLVGVVALWSAAAFLVDRFVININGQAKLPTERFLASGAGRVLDVGAGTGRSSIMVLEARPHTTLVASDLFGESFDEHFGREGSPEQRLFANLKAAGVYQRATIVKADMRKLPFGSAEFDAVVSAYAMDHVNRAGSDQAIAEAARVLKSGGEFLLMVVAVEPWTEFAFGPLLMHSGRGSDWWTEHVRNAGFEVMEEGTRPFTFYILARRG